MTVTNTHAITCKDDDTDNHLRATLAMTYRGEQDIPTRWCFAENGDAFVSISMDNHAAYLCSDAHGRVSVSSSGHDEKWQIRKETDMGVMIESLTHGRYLAFVNGLFSTVPSVNHASHCQWCLEAVHRFRFLLQFNHSGNNNKQMAGPSTLGPYTIKPFGSDGRVVIQAKEKFLNYRDGLTRWRSKSCLFDMEHDKGSHSQFRVTDALEKYVCVPHQLPHLFIKNPVYASPRDVFSFQLVPDDDSVRLDILLDGFYSRVPVFYKLRKRRSMVS
eukprot:scaffold12318_cov151-Amphora_coffeaeformis.AAC.4